MDKLSPETLIGENPKCKFYQNDATKDIDQWAKDWGYKVEDFRCLIAEQKSDNVREYILIRDNQVVYANQVLEAVACYIDVIAFGEGKKYLTF